MRLLATLLTGSLLAAPPVPVPPNGSARLLDQPFGRATAILAPDGHHALWGEYAASRLWIEDIRTHAGRPVATFTVQTISVAWAPDSRHFVVNDRPSSSESNAYVFDADTLQRTRLRDLLLKAVPAAGRYLFCEQDRSTCGTVSHGREVMHSFLDVRRWTDNRHVELQVHGNFSGRFRHDNPDGHLYPAGCFDVRLRMGLDGSVRKLSERILEPLSNDPACGWGLDQ